jgi:hypothetical protein
MKKNNEILISRLNECVTDKSLLADEPSPKSWHVIPYETGEFSGNMLAAGEEAFPEEVSLNLGVRGRHKIYLGLVSFGTWDENVAEVYLSGERMRTALKPSHTNEVEGYVGWAGYEFAEEAFFKTADLTGQSLVLCKPKRNTNFTASLMFVRLVPMTDSEVFEEERSGRGKTILYHFDTDYYGDCGYRSANEYAGRAEMLSHGNGAALINENSFDDGNESPKPYTVYKKGSRLSEEANLRYLREKEEIKRQIIAHTHRLGLEIYAGNRMEMGDFFIPYQVPFYNNGLVDQYSQYKCRTRDGRTVDALSYAYPEVRALAIQKLLSAMTTGFDGLSLFFHRGVHVAFERPVVRKVKELYGSDARRLPFSDARLNGVLCGFMTEFMRELKAALQKKADADGVDKYAVNVIVYFDTDSSRNFGLDVETWAREGLIDSVAQGLMKHYEVTDTCLDGDGLIDLEKYKKENARFPVLRRFYLNDTETILSGIAGFLKIKERYGTKFYAALLWEDQTSEAQYQLAKKLYSAGADHLICWNANHIAKKLPVLNAIKYAGDKARVLSEIAPPEFRRLHRVLSIHGHDISSFNPNWRG